MMTEPAVQYKQTVFNLSRCLLKYRLIKSERASETQ